MFKYTLGILFLANMAHADIIKCSFTEPFYDTEYSMAQQKLTVSDFEGTTKSIRNVSFQIKGPGQFELWDSSGNVLQKLNLTNEGSNGMSDFVYPYEVESSDLVYGSGANNGIGGCTSNFLHRKEQSDE